MQEFQEDLYVILGIEENTSPEEIRRAYLKLAKKLHPDRFPDNEEKRINAQIEFSRVTRAYDTLSDPKQREEYDTVRKLTKSRISLDIQEPGTSAATSAPVSSQPKTQEEGELRADNRESWAAKHYARSLDLLSRKRYPEAETAIKEAIRLCPGNAMYHTTLGEVYMARGWKTLATTSIQQALKLDPRHFPAKEIELKLKAQTKKTNTKSIKKSFLDQIKEMFRKKA